MTWDEWYYTPTKRIRVENGIKAKHKRGDFSDKWWSKRWIGVLESFHLGARLERGKSYARTGQVLEMHVEPGMITAMVQGSRPKPYDVTIKLKQFSKQEWERIFDSLASKAIYSAKLTMGEMPRDIESIFNELHIPLFPEKYRDLETSCTCPDTSNPCKHIAAVFYIFAERFEEDPFLIFRLRGKNKEEIIEELRKRRNSDQDEKIAVKDARIEKNIDQFFVPVLPIETFQFSSEFTSNYKIKAKELGDPGFSIFHTEPMLIFSHIYEEVGNEAIKRIKKINES